MDLNTIFRANDRIISRKILDEVILVPVRASVAETESIYTLNEVAARIYGLIDGRRTVAEIRDVIIEEFEVSVGEAEKDVLEFLETLLSIGGIEEVGEGAR